jgi:polysaccharide biosynthesis protein PslG
LAGGVPKSGLSYMKSTILFLAGLSAMVLAAADLPEPVLPQGVGVNIHFTRGHERDLDLIAAAGFKFIRMDFGWGGIERKKGEYNWADYDDLTANLDKRGLRAIYIFDYSNPLHEETVVSKNPLTGQEQKDVASPQHPESVAAFARWAAASLAETEAGAFALLNLASTGNFPANFARTSPK